MNSKYSGVIVIGVLALLVGLLISAQIQTTQGSDIGGLIPIAKAQGFEAELKKVRLEKDAALQELQKLEFRIAEIEKEKADEDILLAGIIKDLEKYRIAAGVVDVRGPGVTITLEDPVPTDQYQQETSFIMENSELLVSLVNKLKDAGAEAISINGQRIISQTEISLAGDNVNINTVPTAPPYIIKAIGNPDTIESTITIRFGIIEQMRDRFGLQVKIEKAGEVVIPRYSGIIKYRYAKPVEEKQQQ